MVTVTGLLDVARDLLAPIGDVTVTATLIGKRVTRNGGLLGELVDYARLGVLAARIPIVAFGLERRSIETLRDGQRVTVTGRLEITDTYAPFRFAVVTIEVHGDDPHSTTGRTEQYERMRNDGTAGRNRALPFPGRIERIGIVSPAGGGAGRADFLQRLHEHALHVRIIEEPAPMSGPHAPNAIAHAIRLTAASADVVVIIRGGGPSSELTTFDHPAIAVAISQSPVPVIVAVGHSTDRSLADLVCAVSVATPTAAAAWILDHANKTQLDAQRHAIAKANQAAHDRLAALAAREHRHAINEQQLHQAQRRVTVGRRVAVGVLIIAIVTLIAATIR